MNEIVLDDVNGITSTRALGEAGSGIPAFDPDFDQLTAAIERLADGARAARRGRAAAARGRAELAAHRRGLAGLLDRSRHAPGRREQVVQPRPAGGGAPDALGARRARSRDVRPRPPEEGAGPRPEALDRDDVWDQPGVTEASAYEISGAEYERWSRITASRRFPTRTTNSPSWRRCAPVVCARSGASSGSTSAPTMSPGQGGHTTSSSR